MHTPLVILGEFDFIAVAKLCVLGFSLCLYLLTCILSDLFNYNKFVVQIKYIDLDECFRGRVIAHDVAMAAKLNDLFCLVSTWSNPKTIRIMAGLQRWMARGQLDNRPILLL